jgi:ABC-type sugar transport system ATPase subunit
MRDGVVQQVGRPDDVYSRPANTYVATFVGTRSMNLFEGRIVSTNGSRRFEGPFSLELSSALQPRTSDGDIVLGVRPEDVSLASEGDPGQASGVIELGERIGSDVYLSVRMAEGNTIVVSVDASNKVREGETVRMQIPPSNLCFFGSDGNRLETSGGTS